MIGSENANCVEEEHTDIMNVLLSSNDNTEETSDDIEPFLPQFTRHHYSSGCRDLDCSICSSSIAYIAGFLVFYISKKSACQDCKDLLHHSPLDPCMDKSLMLAKSFNKDLVDNYSKEEGLAIPSGTVEKLIKKSEFWLRSCTLPLSTKNLSKKMVAGMISSIQDDPVLYSFETCYLLCKHGTALLNSLMTKFVNMRLRKIMSDAQKNVCKGSYLNRSRIFQHV